jgi:hypothetical protein
LYAENGYELEDGVFGDAALGYELDIASENLSVARMSATSGVMVGIERYLCLKKHGITDGVTAGVQDVDLVETVVLMGVANVIFRGGVSFPSIANCGVEVCFNPAP